MKYLFFALLLPISAFSQRIIIDRTLGDTTIIPCACDAVIRPYKLPNNANRPPVAIVADNFNLNFETLTASMILDASCSYDPEGGVLRFFWRKISGPSVTLTETNKPMCYVSNMGVGTYTFEVRVVDPMNTFSAKNVVVVVKSD